MRYAVVLDNVVLCVSEWDGSTVWEPPFGGTAVPLAPDEKCEAGWSFIATAEPRFDPPMDGAQ